MGVLDALTILGAGASRGYRNSQELQRRIAEEKRKALLEERELAVREQTAQSQRALAEAQIKNEALKLAIGEYEFDIDKANRKRSQQPITPGGAPLKFKLGKQEITLPSDTQTLTEQDGLIREILGNMFKAEHPEFYTNYPPAGTAAAQIRNSPEARGREYIQQILTGNPAMELTEDEESYNRRVQRLMKTKLDFLNEQDPEALKALFGKTTTKTDTTKVRLQGGKDRFTGVKVK